MLRRIGPAFIFFAAIVLCWHGLLTFHLISPASLAYPYEVLLVLPSIFSPTGNLSDVLSTLS